MQTHHVFLVVAFFAVVTFSYTHSALLHLFGQGWMLSKAATASAVLVHAVGALVVTLVAHVRLQPNPLRFSLQGGQFVNWEQRVTCTPTRLLYPESVSDVREIVEQARAAGRRLRVVGGGHSWNDSACSRDTMVSLDRMDAVLSMDASQVTVEAGIRMEVLQDRLADSGLAFHALPSVAAQSAGGIIATATHSNGPGHPNLAAYVRAMAIVTGTGELKRLSREETPDELEGAAVHLGVLGIVVEVSFDVRPLFKLQKTEEPLHFADEFLPRLPDLLCQERFFKCWYFPHTGRCQMYRYREVGAQMPDDPSALVVWLKEVLLQQYVSNAVLWVTAHIPVLIPPVTRLMFWLGFKRDTRVARYDRLFNIAVLVRHHEIELAFPPSVPYATVLRRVQALVDDCTTDDIANFPVEIRFVRSDGLWMSNNFSATDPLGATEGPWMHITMMMYARPVDTFFARCQALGAEYGARPHWGKWFDLDAARVAELYPKMGAFARLRDAYDPDRVFLNDHTARLFPPSPSHTHTAPM